MIMVIPFLERPGVAGTRFRGKSEWHEDLEEQRGNRQPGRDTASDSIAHRRLAAPAVAMRAEH